MQYRQKTLPEPQCIRYPETVYFLQCLLQGAPKTAAKIAKNRRFEIPPFALSPIGNCNENFNIGAPLHLFRYRLQNGIKSLYQSTSLVVVLVRTNIRPLARFFNHLHKFVNLWCPQLKNYPKNFIQVHIYNHVATKCWWNFIYRLPVNDRSRQQTFLRDFYEFPKSLQIPAKIVAPPNVKPQEDASC